MKKLHRGDLMLRLGVMVLKIQFSLGDFLFFILYETKPFIVVVNFQLLLMFDLDAKF